MTWCVSFILILVSITDYFWSSLLTYRLAEAGRAARMVGKDNVMDYES